MFKNFCELFAHNLQVNYLTLTQLTPCVTYQITVTPKLADNVSGLSAKTEATVMSEGTYDSIMVKQLYLILCLPYVICIHSAMHIIGTHTRTH